MGIVGTVARTTAVLAARGRTSPRPAKMSAITAVAKTSKKPSTQRWTTHQRKYSIIDSALCRPQVSAAP